MYPFEEWLTCQTRIARGVPPSADDPYRDLSPATRKRLEFVRYCRSAGHISPSVPITPLSVVHAYLYEVATEFLGGYWAAPFMPAD